MNSSVTFTVSLTNLAGFTLANVSVTNSFSGPPSLQVLAVTNSQGVVATNSGSLAFNLGALPNGGVATMSVTIRPSTSGALTNTTFVRSATITNTASTNVVVQVAPLPADLAVSLAPPVTPVLVDDWINYRVTVTNLGTNAVASVMLTNSGFSAMLLRGFSPANQSYTLTNGLLVLDAGPLPALTGKSFTLSVQPTNAGLLTLSASIATTDIAESTLTNNTASARFTVENFLAGDLIATNASAMIFNPQTGLMEQVVRLSNAGTNSVASARVIVSGLTNRLYNAAGTNNGSPFVVYGAALDPGQAVDLLMEYFIPARLPITVSNSAYTAVGASALNPNATYVPAPNITLITNLLSGAVMIEFESIPNRSYTILYSGDSTFTNALAAQPAIVAPADRVQWIDSGPPKTISHPTNAGSRFYRVLLDQ